MDRQILNFTANEQMLTVDEPIRISTNKVNYIEAHFALGDNWSGYDSVRAVWFNDYQTISTVLDSQGVCRVPFEVMKRKGKIQVDLVGSISEGDVLTDRLTSYPVVAVIVDCIAQITGAETNPITPSQFEQYVAIVRDLVDSVKDIDYIELNDDYTLTIYYSDGTSYTTTSIRGEQGADGNGIASVELNPDYTLTITYTDGTSYTTTSIRGEKGEKGDKGEQGEVSQAQLDAAVTDLKSDIDLLKDSASADITVEIGKNRYISNGNIATSNTPTRASTNIISPEGTTIYVKPKGRYTMSVGEKRGDTWVYLCETSSQILSAVIGTNDFFISIQAPPNTNIPTDATADDLFELYYSIDGVIDAFNNISLPNINNYNGIELGWKIGTLNSSNGKEQSGNTRARSDFFKVGKYSRIGINDATTYGFLVYFYDLNKSFIRAETWHTNDTLIESDCYIRILVRYNTNAVITSSTLDEVSGTVVIDYAIPKTLFADGIIYNIAENKHKKAEIEVFKQKKTSSEAWSECDAKLMFFTDVHGDAKRTARMTQLVNNWGSSYFDSAICGGDIVTNLETEDITWYTNAVNNLAVPLLNVIGNHDAWKTSGGGTVASKTDVYAKFIAPFVSGSGIVQPNNASENGYNYYYKDFNNIVRLVVLDCMFWDATQLSWFESVLADSKTNNKHVLCVSHAAFPLADMQKVDCLWSKSGINTDSIRTNIQAAQAVKNFMDDGGTFIAWVVGHQHGDYVHTLPNYGNQFVINLASFAQRAGWLLKSADASNYNYDCLTYIAVDATNKNIRFMRIGANIDIFGTQYHGLVIDYGNNQLISDY